MATDLNQLFNQLIPMLLQASRQRKRDDLNERRFQAQQQQNTQDRAKEEKRYQEGVLRQDLEDKQNRSNDVYKTYLNSPLEHKKMMLLSDVDIGGINKTAALQSVDKRLIKQAGEEDRDRRKDESAIRASDALTETRKNMFSGMSPSDIANFEFYEGRVETAETKEQAEGYHRQALTYLPKTKGIGAGFYDRPENIERWAGIIKSLKPKATDADIDNIIDAMAEEGLGDADVNDVTNRIIKDTIKPPTEAQVRAQQNRALLGTAIRKSPLGNLFKNIQVGGRTSKLIF